MNRSEDTKIWTDPIVEEVHRIRAAMSEEFDTTEKLFEELRRGEEEERKAGRVILQPPSKEPPHAPAH